MTKEKSSWEYLLQELGKALIVGLSMGFLAIVGWIAKEQFTISYNLSRITTALEMREAHDQVQTTTHNKLIYDLQQQVSRLEGQVHDLKFHPRPEAPELPANLTLAPPKLSPPPIVLEPTHRDQMQQVAPDFENFDRNIRMQIQEQIKK